MGRTTPKPHHVHTLTHLCQLPGVPAAEAVFHSAVAEGPERGAALEVARRQLALPRLLAVKGQVERGGLVLCGCRLVQGCQRSAPIALILTPRLRLFVAVGRAAAARQAVLVRGLALAALPAAGSHR